MGTEILLRRIGSSNRQCDLEFIKTESTEQIESKLNAINYLSAHCLGSTENVRIVLGESAHPHQPVQGTGQFRAIAGAQFGVSQRQVAIGTLGRLIDANMERAIHRLEPELRSFHLSRREHHIGKGLFVAAQLPKLAPGNVRRKHQPISALHELVAQIVLHLLANHTALRVPKNQTLSVLLLNRKQIQLAAQPTMIAPLGFLALLNPRLEFLWREESRAIDAL